LIVRTEVFNPDRLLVRFGSRAAMAERAEGKSMGRIDAQSADRLITLSARPEPVQIAVGRSAVVVVDMQNDFGARGGMFDRAGIDIAPIERVVEPTARVLDAARSAGVPIVYLTMQFSADLAQLGSEDAPNRVKHHGLALGTTMTAPERSPRPHYGRGNLEH
jgi:Isochorismatase family